ncbi:MAG: hypothetical protein JST35_03770 [Armatimonadetes bacterium]|nr:hypothetical protein [Armatimonadota bacterium]
MAVRRDQVDNGSGSTVESGGLPIDPRIGIGGAVAILVYGVFNVLWKRAKFSSRVELSPSGIRFRRGTKVIWTIPWDTIVYTRLQEIPHEKQIEERLHFILSDGSSRRIVTVDEHYGPMPQRDQFIADLQSVGFEPIIEQRAQFGIF